MQQSHTNRHILGGETTWNHQEVVKLTDTPRYPALGAVLMDSLDHLSLQHVFFNKTHPYLSTKRGGKLQIWRIKAQELGFESYIYRKAMFGW